MAHRDGFWKLAHLSDAQLLESLGGVLRAQHRALADLIAHLVEVEERRLHLEAAYSSMFSYCVARLGMSEDEACRRIELARLARRFPALFSELASGQITLSVALVLGPVMTPSNHLELLAAARGKCIRQARELVAERFPKPDAPSTIRKLPERRITETADLTQASLTVPSFAFCPATTSVAATLRGNQLPPPDLSEASSPTPDPPSPAVPAPSLSIPSALSPAPASTSSAPTLPSPAVATDARSSTPPAASAPPASRNVIEPLSAERYRIQFTADIALKKKLELARDLLRHAHPSGDFAPVISRALDLLLDDLLRCHFGAGAPGKRRSPASPKGSRTPLPASTPELHSDASVPASAARVPLTQASASESASEAVSPVTQVSASEAIGPEGAPSAAGIPTPIRPAAPRPHVPRAARRAVLERDGLGCSWVDEHGRRCGSQAWLQLDHRAPVGKGGGSEPDNLRLLCRAHNRLAAEHAYGREDIERKSTRRRQAEHPRDPPA